MFIMNEIKWFDVKNTRLICVFPLTVGDLLSLLKWKAHPERIQDTLHKVMKLNGEETVKVTLFST